MTGSWCNVRHPKGSVHTPWGIVPHTKRVTNEFNSCTYGYTRKPYTRDHPYPAHPTRYPIRKREKVVIIMLRKHGYPMNMIAKMMMRSTSYVYRTLRAAILRLCLRSMDLRKLPGNTRIRTSGIRWRTLIKYWRGWEAFLLGEEDKPP